MKKVNKALMATVAILLSLVLISTSVLSGVFAKFVDTKSAGATVSLKAFGLELSVDKTGNATYSTGSNSISASVQQELSGVVAHNYLLQFDISGTPSVKKVNLVLTIDMVDVSDFYFNANEHVNGISAGYHIPLGFLTWVSSDKDNQGRLSSNKYWTYDTTIDKLKTQIASGIKSDIASQVEAYSRANNKYSVSYSSNVVTMEIWNTDKGDALTLDWIRFGFYPYNDKSRPNDLSLEAAKILQTYIYDQNPTLIVKYTVSIEQGV